MTAGYSLPSFSRSAVHNARPSRAPGSFAGIGRTAVWTMTSFDVGSTVIDWPWMPRSAKVRRGPGGSQTW